MKRAIPLALIAMLLVTLGFSLSVSIDQRSVASSEEAPLLATGDSPVTPLPVPDNSDAAWELVWNDEFNADAGTPINDAYWTCEIGGHGWGNAQLEYDTDRVENVAQDGAGHLVITARAESYRGNTHTSARCNTRAKVEFTYGKIEARINLPQGQGIWPAFWMLGADFGEVGWPDCGEIDIMEYIGREPQTIYGTIHGPGYSGASGIGSSRRFNIDVADDYHVFGIEWGPNIIRWHIDGRLFYTVTPNTLGGREWVFDHDFYLIINVAVGGYWPGNPDDTTEFPQRMLIDWIRVYQTNAEE
jgi:beta-glucanase (GH16 family)